MNNMEQYCFSDYIWKQFGGRHERSVKYGRYLQFRLRCENKKEHLKFNFYNIKSAISITNDIRVAFFYSRFL